MPRVQIDPEGVMRQAVHHPLPHGAARNAGAHQTEPVGQPLQIGAGEHFQIAARRLGQVIRPAGQPSRPADIRPPVADVEGNRAAPAQNLPRRPAQPLRGPRARGKGGVAPQGQPAHGRRLKRRKIGHPFGKGEDHAPQGMRGHLVGKFQTRNLSRIDGTAQTVTGMHEQIGRSHHRPGTGAQRIGDEGGQVQRRFGVIHLISPEILPPGRPHPCPGGHLCRQDIRQPRRAPGLRDQREGCAMRHPDRAACHQR